MRPYSYIAIFAAAVLAVCGCQNELELDSRVDGISFNPFIDGVTNTEMTKASAFRSADGSVEIPAWLTVSDGISVMPDSDPASSARHAELDSASDEIAGQARNDEASPATKGDQINTTGSSTALANFASAIGNTFYVTGWKGSTPARFIPSSGTGTYEAVTYSNSKWSTITTDWDGTEDAFFYAYANLPASGATVTNGSASYQALNYTAVPTTASAQKDILLGYGTFDDVTNASDRNATDKTCTAALQFHHPLTAVKFKKGDFSGTTVNFKAIYIDGVYKDGVAYLLRNGASYMMQWNMSSSTKQEVGQEGNSYLTVTDNVIGDTFLLIPQEITTSAPVTVTVVAEIDGTVHPLIATLDTGEWQAGKTYTYTLGYEIANYTFSLSSTSSVTTAEKTFNNTTDTDEQKYDIYSKKTTTSTTDWDWDIKSYQIGTAESVPVDESSTNFTAGGLTVTEDKTNNKLIITAQAKIVGSQGSNAYWQNTTPARTENLDWSPAEWTSYGTIDLSKYDYKTDTRDHHSMTTANCYIIRHAGTYKIPLVYGNAVKDGAINTTAYNPGTTGTSNLSSYVTHKGIAITSPFIEYNKTSSSSSINLSPTGCRVVWSENSGVISHIEIPSPKESVTIGGTTYNISYLTFTVPQDKICQNNAVIAVSDGSGTMWSWHIWTTNDPDVAKDPIAVTNSTKEYDFFPMNFIGWIDPSSYSARDQMKVTLVQKKSGNEITITVNQPQQFKDKAQGLMYQWGRKDPMPTKSSLTGFEVKTQDSGVSLADAIKYPGTAYYPTNTTGGNWCSTNYYNLWSGTLGTPIYNGSTKVITASNDATTKTVYDPSPVGYKVPSIYAYTPFSKTGASSTSVSDFNKKGDFNVGWDFYTCPSASVTATTPTIFFYAAGWRSASGLTNSTNGDGNYHSAFQYGTASDNSNHMCYLAFGDNSLYLTNTQSKSLGACVRPVKE